MFCTCQRKPLHCYTSIHRNHVETGGRARWGVKSRGKIKTKGDQRYVNIYVWRMYYVFRFYLTRRSLLYFSKEISWFLCVQHNIFIQMIFGINGYFTLTEFEKRFFTRIYLFRMNFLWSFLRNATERKFYNWKLEGRGKLMNGDDFCSCAIFQCRSDFLQMGGEEKEENLVFNCWWSENSRTSFDSEEYKCKTK